MAEELPLELRAEIDHLAEEGNGLIDAGSFAEAIAVFRKGLDLLPKPLHRWQATLWFLAGIGDAQFLANDY